MLGGTHINVAEITNYINLLPWVIVLLKFLLFHIPDFVSMYTCSFCAGNFVVCIAICLGQNALTVLSQQILESTSQQEETT